MEPVLSQEDARTVLAALPGLMWRPVERRDLPDVAQFYAECEAYDQNPERRSLAGLEEFWDSPRSCPDQDTLLGLDGVGRVVATAWVGCNRVVTERRGVYLGGSVHPSRRGEGLGRAVLRWQLAHGVGWDRATRRAGFGPLVMRLYAPTHQADLRDLAERHGLTVARYFFEMSRRLSEPVVTSPPEGVFIVDWDDDRSNEIHQVVDVAFRDHWGHVDRTDQMWEEIVTGHAFRRDWSAVAVERSTGAVVGAALNCAYEQDWPAKGFTEGYTDELAVAASFRGRGIATALLHESMNRFAKSGMDAAEDPATSNVAGMPPAPAPTTWAGYARELGLELQRRRVAAGLTQEDLAQQAGLTRTHYQQIEKGEWKRDQPANPSLKVLARLARVLDLQVGELLPDVNRLEL